MNIALRLLLVLSLAPTIAFAKGATRVESPLLGDYRHFETATWDRNVAVYRNPEKRVVSYKKFIFDPALISQSKHSKYQQLSPDETLLLSQVFRDVAAKKFASEIVLVDQPGLDTARVRFCVRGLKPGRYHFIESGPTEVKKDGRLAAGTFEIEVIDSLSGERILAMVNHWKGDALDRIEPEEALPTIGEAYDEWLDGLLRLFREEKAAAGAPARP